MEEFGGVAFVVSGGHAFAAAVLVGTPACNFSVIAFLTVS